VCVETDLFHIVLRKGKRYLIFLASDQEVMASVKYRFQPEGSWNSMEISLKAGESKLLQFPI
jgi:hypothetical protein